MLFRYTFLLLLLLLFLLFLLLCYLLLLANSVLHLQSLYKINSSLSFWLYCHNKRTQALFLLLLDLLFLVRKFTDFSLCLIKLLQLLDHLFLDFSFVKLNKSWNILISAERNTLQQHSHISFMFLVIVQEIFLFHRSISVLRLKLLNILFGDFLVYFSKVFICALKSIFIEFVSYLSYINTG